MSLVKFTLRRKVAVVTFESINQTFPWGTLSLEHRFNSAMMKDLTSAINQCENQMHSLNGIVFTGEGRFFSNGFDVNYFQGISHSAALDLQIDYENLICRILKFPVTTVAALNGHTAAAGAFLSLAFDYRLMNSEHGIFYIPAAQLGLTLSPGLVELCRFKMTPQVFRDATLMSRKYTASEAHASGIVDLLFPGNELVDQGVKLCESISFPQSDFKARLNRSIIESFETASRNDRDMGWAKFTSKL